MSQNPILVLLKIVAFAVLALLVGLVFFQRGKMEEKQQMILERLGKLETGMEKANGGLSILRDKLKDGNLAVGPARQATKTPEDYAWGKTPPPWVEGRAAELWGAHDNYLKPDPNWPTYPKLDDPKVNPEGKLTFWYGSQPPDSNAFTLNESDFNQRVRQYCHEYWGVSHSQNPYLYRPALAYRVEVSPDYKTWTFWMRPGVKWHTPQVDLSKYPHLKGDHYLTAHDWKFTMDTVMHPDVQASHTRTYFTGFNRCEVVDDLCFIMHWDAPVFTAASANMNLLQPVPKFIYGFDESGNPIPESNLGTGVNEHWFGKGFHFVGCGPYFVKEFKKDDYVITERFNDYWGQKPAIKTREMHIIQGSAPAMTKFEAGDFGYQSYRPPDFEKRIEASQDWKDGKIGKHQGWSYSYLYIGYKNTHPIFKDVRVRRAMTHACDRERMLEITYFGEGKIVTGPQYWRAPTAPKDITPIPFDLEKAEALLKEAGWKRGDSGLLEKEIDGVLTPFEVTAKIPSSSDTIKTVFDVFIEDLAKIGVKMELQALQWSQYLQEVTDDRDFEVCSLGWSTGGWDSDMMQIWHSSQIEQPKSSNHIEFSDAEVDRLIDLAKGTFDLEERIKVQGAAHRRINELQPYTFLFTPKSIVCYRKDQLSPIGEGERWQTRPFLRTWPLFVPAKD